ncbi:MAG: hypothetical protein J5499_05175 [Lachnospiraceae bacterium]|nr:hypothetical protein [Lachnospiraceae bacterium]
MKFFRKDNDVLLFFIGLVMLIVGGFIFFKNVSIMDGSMFAFSIGGYRLDGLVFVPLIASIVFLFYKYCLASKLCCIFSIILILINVIMNLRLRWRETSLFSGIIMFVLLFGGAGLLLRVIFANPNGKHGKNYKTDSDKDTKEEK